MLTAGVMVLIVSLHVVNAPMETTYGLQPPPPRALGCLGLPDHPMSPGSERIPAGMAYLDDPPPPLQRHPEPRAVDVLRNAPALLSALFAGLAVLFAAAAGLGWLLLRTAAGVRRLSRVTLGQGIDPATP